MNYGLRKTLEWIGNGQDPVDVEARRQAHADYQWCRNQERKERAKVRRDARRSAEKAVGDSLKAKVI
jgi:hypothetical protein